MLTDEGVISLDVRMCFFKKFQTIILRNLRFVQRKTCTKESKNFDIKIFLKSEKCIWLVLCNLKNLEKFESKNSNVLWWAWIDLFSTWLILFSSKKNVWRSLMVFVKVCVFVCFSWQWRLWVLVWFKVWIKVLVEFC